MQPQLTFAALPSGRIAVRLGAADIGALEPLARPLYGAEAFTLRLWLGDLARGPRRVSSRQAGFALARDIVSDWLQMARLLDAGAVAACPALDAAPAHYGARR